MIVSSHNTKSRILERDQRSWFSVYINPTSTIRNIIGSYIKNFLNRKDFWYFWLLAFKDKLDSYLCLHLMQLLNNIAKLSLCASLHCASFWYILTVIISIYTFLKGQLISKCLLGVFNFFQKTNENTWHSSKNEFIHSFFGRIHGLTICFRN